MMAFAPSPGGTPTPGDRPDATSPVFLAPWIDRTGRALGGGAAVVGAAALAGWLAGVPRLTHVLPNLPPMMPATAAAVTLAGAGLASFGGRRSRAVAGGLAACVVLIAAAAGVQQATGVRASLGPFAPGRMAPQAAAGLALAGVAVAAAVGRRAATAGGFGLAAGVVGYVALLGVLHGTVLLERIAAPAGVSPLTAVALMLLAAGVLYRTADRGVGRLMADPRPVGMVVRSGLLLLALMPVLSAAVLAAGASRVLSPGLAGLVQTTATVAVVAGVVGWTAARVAHWDRVRSASAAAMLADRERLRAVLNALPGHIGLIGPTGDVLAVNRAWSDAATGAADPLGRCRRGENYLDACDRAADPHPRDTAAGVRSVLAGTVPRFTLDYPCHTPTAQHWYRVIVCPFRDGPAAGAVVMHLDISDQVAAAQARQASDERFKRLVERSPNSVAVIDTSNRVAFINPACERLFGYTLAEYHADPDLARNMVAEEFRPEFDAVWSKFAAGGEFPEVLLEWLWRTKDGRTIEVEHRIINVRDDDGKVTGYLAVSRDVTAERKAERALRASEEMLVEVGRVARVGGWELDLATGWPSWSDEVRQIHEVDAVPGGLSVADGLSFYPEPGRAVLAAALAAASTTGEPFDLELPFDTATGRRLWVRVSGRAEAGPDGRPARLYGSFQDVTQFHDAQDALRTSERRFRALVEQSSDGIALLDADGRFLYLSPPVRDILGYPLEAMCGRAAADFLHPDDAAAAQAHFTAVLAAGGRALPCRLRYRHADGSYRVLAGVKADRRDDPAVGAVVANFRDVTDREQLEDQLRQAQKMDAVGRLAGGVAHDFNNLLTVILGFGDMALAGLAPTDPVRDWVDQMVQAGRRAADLTRQLLAFSRKQVTRPKVLDLGAVVAGMERMLTRMIGEHIALGIEISPRLWPVKADPGQVEQVVMNLTVNARDAMPDGGRVTIRVENQTPDRLPADAPADATPGDYVVLSVADTGCGMDAATRARAFEPFFTTKGPDQGTGLGLATVYGIARHSGGFVTVESEVGVGSTFRVYLPRTRDAASAESSDSAEAGKRGRETVLLVEDDDSVRTLARFTLQRHGYRVIEAENGQAAMFALDDPRAADLRLLVTDVVMPGMSGREVADRVVRARPGVRVLFLSGYPRDHIGQGGVVDDRTAFLQKPFLPDALARKVREVLDTTQ